MKINKLAFILFLWGSYMCGAAQGTTLGANASVSGFVTIGFLLFVSGVFFASSE